MKLFIWTDEVSYTAFAHAESVAEARKLLIPEIGGYDGSCMERAKARKSVDESTPAIYVGRTSGFRLSDSAEVRELEAYLEKLSLDVTNLRQEVTDITAERDRLQAELEEQHRCLSALLALAEERVNRLRWAMRESIINAGGVAASNVSDDFLCILPTEVGAIKYAQRKAEKERDAATARADAAEAALAEERARLDWLGYVHGEAGANYGKVTFKPFHGGWVHYTGNDYHKCDSLRAAIDAARREQP